MKYYYTFGYYGQPHHGGWVEVIAKTRDEANEKFINNYPLRDGFLPCAFVYIKKEFIKTKMLRNGNYGYKCHRVIE